MRYKITILFTVFWAVLFTSGCGKDPELTQFQADIESFCTNSSALDTAINNIDTTSDDFRQELLSHLDALDVEFQKLGSIDFPEEFDYLEELAVEASEYMSEAVTYYHEAYADNTYKESIAEYAFENYVRAHKRVQIIITYLQGDEPQNSDLVNEH